MLPTILGCCGLPIPGEVRGRDVFGPGPEPDAVFGTYGTVGARRARQPLHAVRTDDWAHIVHGNGGSEELYDRRADPDERRNLGNDPGRGGARRPPTPEYDSRCSPTPPRRSGAGEDGRRPRGKEEAAMARPVTIAALQLPAWTEGGTPSEQKAFRLGQIERWLHEAGRAGAAVAAMGERSTTHGIAVPPGDGAVCEEAYDGPSATLARRLAREYALAIVLPIVARCRGRVQNLALVIARDGEIVGHYANVHPTRAELAQGIVAGDHFPVFDLDFGRIGVVICHDLSFPESTRVLGVRRAEIIFWPTLWSGWGEELCNAVIRSRAIDNGCYLVQANMGQPVGKAWRPGLLLGNSGVIGPDGLTLSSADRHVGMSLATVDLDRPRLAHSFSMSGEHEFRASMLADRRPDAYRPITDPAALPAPLADGLGAARS